MPRENVIRAKMACTAKPISWLVVTLLWLSLPGAGQRPPNAAPMSDRDSRIRAADIPIVNLTQSLQVMTSAHAGDARLGVIITNNSTKETVSFAYSFAPKRGFTEVGGGIAPGESVHERISLAPVIASGQENPTLTILAAIFEDAHGEGNPRFVRSLLDAEAGKEIAYLALNPLIQSIPEPGLDGFSEAIRRVGERLRDIPSPEDAVKSFDLRTGFQGVIDGAASDVDSLVKLRDAYGSDVAGKKALALKANYRRWALRANRSLLRFKVAATAFAR